MRVVVTGATGNVGTSLVRSLLDDASVDEVIGVGRRGTSWLADEVTWHEADISRDDLGAVMAGADAVCHLAWVIQPSRDLTTTHRINVVGSRRVFDAAVAAGARTIVYLSSVGAYSAVGGGTRSPVGRALVDESWPTDGIPTSFYSRQKAYVERVLDRVERDAPDVRVVRFRPALMSKFASATQQRRLFGGPLVPGFLLGRLPFAPEIRDLRLQFAHTDDTAEACRLALHAEVRGAFNLAAAPVLTGADVARALGSHPVPVPAALARAAADLSWRVRLQPTEPGWLDLALGAPLMSTARAKAELGWAPRHSAEEVLAEALAGLRAGGDMATPTLARSTSGPLRSGEFSSGVGATTGGRDR